MNCLSFVSSDKWTFTAYIQIYSYSNASHVFIYTFWIYVFHIQCPTKVFERCNTVDSSPFSFAPSVNIIAKWKYWYVHLMLGYRFSNSNVQVCTIVFKMNTKVWNKNCKREIIFRIHGDGKSYNEIGGIVNRSYTIHYIIKTSKNEGTLANKARSGRPKKLTGRTEKVIIRELKKILLHPLLKSQVWQLICFIKKFIWNYVDESYETMIFMTEYHGKS